MFAAYASLVALSERRINPASMSALGEKMSCICRFCSVWFDVTVEPGLIQPRTEPKRRNDNALHGDS